MTVITENFIDIAGADDTGIVEFYCFNPRRSSDQTAVITQKKVIVLVTDGILTSPELDPGPARAVITMGTWRRSYDFIIPNSGSAQLFSLPEFIIDPLTQKPTVQGPPGPPGDPGPPGNDGVDGADGADGAPGAPGAPGPPNVLTIGTVTGGITADATITGTSPSQALNLVLPKGDKGDQGDQGDPGDPGSAGPPNVLTIGTVTSGSSPDVTITGTSPSQELNFVLQAGPTGASSTWIAGSGAPSNGTGNNGDMYLNIATGDVYGPKSGGTWGSIVINLVGPAAADATTTSKGIIQLAGDLGGTAASPTVPNKANKTITITAGTGLSGGGDLSANRTLSVSYGTSAGTAAEGNDTRIVNAVPNTRSVLSGTGLTGGGTLAADRTLAVSYGTTAGTAAQGNDSRITGAVQSTRQVISGTGLSGGGDLSADRTLSVSYGTIAGTATQGNDTRVVNAVQNTRTIASGAGLTGGGDLSADRTLAVSYGTTAGTATQGNDTRVVNAVQTSRQVASGTGLSGGGDLSADRTLTVVYGTTSGTACQGNDSRLSNTRTPSPSTVPCDFVWVAQSNTRTIGTGDLAAGMYVGRAFTLTKIVYQFDTADASGSTTVELRKNGSQVASSNLTVTAANQADGTSTDSSRTATISVSYAVGDRLAIAATALGTTPGKGLRAYLLGTWD